MSQRHKRSLWQKIKQLLITSKVQSAISDIKAPDDLPAAGSNHENDSKITHSAVDTELNSVDSNCINNNSIDSKSTDNEYSEITDNSDNDSPIDNGSAIDNDNTINNPVEAETDLDSNFDNIAEQDITAQHEAEHTPIIDYLKQYFDDKGWHYHYYQPKKNDHQQSHHLSLRMINKQLDCGYLFRVQEANNLLAVYGILPFLIPDSHQSAAMLLITQINYDMLIGNLEMDINDGEIRYKNAIDIEAVGIDDHTIEHLLQSVIAMTTVAYEIFSDLINNQNPAEELPDLLIQLRQQVDSRTFFLPTQFVQ